MQSYFWSLELEKALFFPLSMLKYSITRDILLLLILKFIDFLFNHLGLKQELYRKLNLYYFLIFLGFSFILIVLYFIFFSSRQVLNF